MLATHCEIRITECGRWCRFLPYLQLGYTDAVMTHRRAFLQTVAGVGAAAAAAQATPQTPESDRQYWVRTMGKVAEPVLTNLAAGTLKRNMPVECVTGDVAERRKVTHLEAIGRLPSDRLQVGHLAPLGDIPRDALHGHIPFERCGGQVGQHGFRHLPHGSHPILPVAFRGLRRSLRSGGRGAHPRNGLKKCTSMSHDGISVLQLHVLKKNDTSPAHPVIRISQSVANILQLNASIVWRRN